MTNNIPILSPTSPALSRDQQDVIHALKEALEQAEAGNIDCIGIVACMKGGYAPIIVGSRAGDLMLGVFRMMLMIDEATHNAPETLATNRLVRARTI